jgi:hypothetical protein
MSKAQSFQGMAAMGRVWLPEGPEGDAILDELVKFPAGAHDEEVDNGAMIGRALMEAHPAIIKIKEKKPESLAAEDWSLVLGTEKKRGINMESTA